MSLIEEHHNIRTGEMAKGCQLCVQGKKLVLFVTGVCGNGCDYCPVSDAKNHHDVIFANEMKVKTKDELFKEAEMMDAKGAGITGGDPLAVLERTVQYIKDLKGQYGKEFHIHLYTPLLRVNEHTLQKLYDAGLDEIRFHPKLDDPSEWHKLKLAKAFDWQVGVEVPAIPEHEKGLIDMLHYLAKEIKPDFINLNEFEYADNQVFEESGKHYEPKDQLSYGVKGSEDTAKKLLVLGEELALPVHFCTAKSKDSVQLAQRIKRRSKHAAKEYDAVDDEGLFTRGAIYDSISLLDVNPLEKIRAFSDKEKQAALKRLEDLRQIMLEEWAVPEELIGIDQERLRILTTTSVAEHAAQILNNTVALVREYPTDDCFIVEAQVLKDGNKN